MYVRKRIALTATTAILGGVLAATPAMAAAPSAAGSTAASAVAAAHTTDSGDSTAVKTTWKRVWGPAKISAAYLNSHGKKWESQNYTQSRPANSAKVTFKCWNNGDKGKARVRIKDMNTGRILASSGFRLCDWKKHSAVGNYYTGHKLRVLLDVKGKAHTTDITAYRGY
ncbi:hypothetical protein I5Q34_25835 [Streptomyces sp. AV19]|uniref:hypothetical protein n=1 Tax=Streptomyces sp. AV19 TaxID=2793068 RepID=UPI0018FEC14D|nr:hypothetical protein [Streptomyces sp. AV19]MBH1937650.1 hypothetical protein [Streptomyces sp. AV19]MDG4536319.1 hypothetical protein [Streptomyces sp. AV19]